MAHQTVKSSYASLVDRLNRHPQGAPPSDVLYQILALLFSEREASLVAQLPIRPFTASKAARIWKLPELVRSSISWRAAPSFSTSKTTGGVKGSSCRRPWPAFSSSP